jgi:protein SMG7
MDSKFRDHDKIVYQDFRELVAERHLPIDMISNVVVLAQSALWKHRMIRDSPSKHRQDPPTSTPESSIVTEWRMLHHLLDIHSALMETGKDQLKDLPSLDAVDNDLAQRITAVFRRTLPALRIASKWLRANVGYVMGDLEFKAYQDKEKLRSVTVEKKSTKKFSAHSVHTIRFWQGYAQFVTMLSQAFPPSKLPALTTPLEEDVDLRGFLPMKKLIMGTATSTPDVATGGLKESPHPNEEQLMRISDLLSDASALLSAEVCICPS